MRRFIFNAICFSAGFLLSLTAFSQNLILNPGFESDKTNWNGFWSKEGTGSATIVTSPAYSGNKALKIEYPGTQDWAFTSARKIPVSPGSTFDMSCWTQVSSVTSNVHFSLVLYDASQTVVNWVYSPIVMNQPSSAYTQSSITFIVPEGIKYIQPRFEGWGSCVFFADDVSLAPSNSSGIMVDYTVENEKVKAVVHLPVFSVTLTNKTSAKSYETGWAQFAVARSAEQISSTIFRVKAEMLNESKSEMTVEFAVEGKALRMTMSGDSSMVLNSDIQFPGLISNKADDYLIIPRGTGIRIPVTGSSPFGNFATYNWKSTMPFVGVTNQKEGYMVATDDQFDAEFQFEKPVGQSFYSFRLKHKPSKSTLGYNRTTYLVAVDNGYVEMCNWYRTHAEKMGYVKTLTQKRHDNENMDKLIGAVDFWPLSLNLNVSFLRTAKLMGIDKAIWNLTGGWGVKNFSALVDSLNSMGFLSDRYDIFTDVWPENSWGYRFEGYPDDVIVDPGGNLKKGWLAYHNEQPFQGYYTCSATHKAYAQSYVQSDLAINNYNSRFIDVELASSLEECFSVEHPVTRKQDAEARNQLLSFIKNDLNLVTGVEEAHDFAFQNADYGEGTMTIVPATNAGYDWSQPLEPTDKTYEAQNISPEMRIPLHGLVYHDVHIPTWYTGDGVSKVPAFWDDKDLWNILYGSMPLFMPPSLAYWNTNIEKFISSYHLVSAVTRNVGYSKMTNHEFLSADLNIQKTTFDNGWNVVVNFDSIAHGWNDLILAPKGFYASGGTVDEAFRLEENGKIKAGNISGERLFFNPYGSEQTWKGLRTMQSVFIQKYPDFLLVSFIGKQNYLDLNVAELPFDVEEIVKVSEYYSGSPVSLSDTGNGWKRLNRPSGKSFFKVYYKPKSTGIMIDRQDCDFKVYPNPAQNLLTIQKSSSDDGYFSICNPQGQEILKQTVSGIKSQVDIGLLSSGIYFLSLFQDETRKVRKFVKR